MRQDSETNIIVLNTALKYKIPRNKKTQTYNYTQTHTKKSQCRSQRSKSLYRGKLVTSHGRLFQTLITYSEKT